MNQNNSILDARRRRHIRSRSPRILRPLILIPRFQSLQFPRYTVRNGPLFYGYIRPGLAVVYPYPLYLRERFLTLPSHASEPPATANGGLRYPSVEVPGAVHTGTSYLSKAMRFVAMGSICMIALFPVPAAKLMDAVFSNKSHGWMTRP